VPIGAGGDQQLIDGRKLAKKPLARFSAIIRGRMGHERFLPQWRRPGGMAL
jgi:hypothetical protein